MKLDELLSLSAEEALAEGFARSIVEAAGRLGGCPQASLPVLHEAARAASLATAAGHTCVPLAELAGAATRDALLATGVVTTADNGGRQPLVIDAADRLYLYRYFAVERRLAARLAACGRAPPPQAWRERLRQRLDERFGGDDAAATNQQKRAAAVALEQSLTVISGGPGTGKTSTVVQILALWLEVDPACRVLLAAPTGKAAARLRDAVQAGGARLPDAVRAALPKQSFTIHRLLAKAAADGGHLACDLLVVDEASMLDLLLADRLLGSLHRKTRLILLGDRHQLAAVEAGAVFSALGALARRDQVVELSRSYRFAADTALGRLAAATRDGRVDAALAALTDTDESARLDADGGAELAAGTIETLVDAYAPYRQAVSHAWRAGEGEPTAVFTALARFRVLCAVRDGHRGVAGINETLARRHRALLGESAGTPWYPGRPVLITRNDALLRLFNGDIGVALPAAAGGFTVWFEDTAAPTGFRAVSPARLPPHETAFAMTVHKAQGSEFDRVAVVLPATPTPICTRELVYTAITRARQAVTIVAPATVLAAALATPTSRHSGLHDRLLEASPGDAL